MIKQQKNRFDAIFGKEKRPTLVTFRIDEDLWARFDEYAKSQEVERSALIRKFIKDCVKKLDD